MEISHDIFVLGDDGIDSCILRRNRNRLIGRFVGENGITIYN